MAADRQSALTSTTMIWTGRVISGLIVAMLLMSGVMKILLPPEAAKGFEQLGWPTSTALTLAVLEIGSAIIYAIPQTAVLGAILLTGYLGGATATHVRIGENGKCLVTVGLGVLVWVGLFLRDARLRALIPLRQ